MLLQLNLPSLARINCFPVTLLLKTGLELICVQHIHRPEELQSSLQLLIMRLCSAIHLSILIHLFKLLLNALLKVLSPNIPLPF